MVAFELAAYVGFVHAWQSRLRVSGSSDEQNLFS